MTQHIALSGVGISKHGESLHKSLVQGKPGVVGIAAAFVSVLGVERLAATLKKSGAPACRLIAGIDNGVTHPEALTIAKDYGWTVRIGRSKNGIFHPKLVVAGKAFM